MVVAVLIAPMMMVFGAATPASATGCWVKNVRTHVVGTDLQEAINASAQGDVIKVRGICDAFATSDQDVKLVGPATIGSPEPPDPWYDSTILANIDGGRVTLKDLTLSGGASTHNGGGIYNTGTVILKGDTKVTRNVAEDGGGGIYNLGLLVMKDHAKVTGNRLLFGSGGGIANEGTLVMKDRARVKGNDGTFGGGVSNSGRMVMLDHSAVVRNNAGVGGGVFSTGTLKMKGASRITRNSASGYEGYSTPGGGIFSDGTVRFSRHWHGTVCGNSPDDWPSCTR